MPCHAMPSCAFLVGMLLLLDALLLFFHTTLFIPPTAVNTEYCYNTNILCRCVCNLLMHTLSMHMMAKVNIQVGVF